MAIDRIDWHSADEEYPENLPPENGGIHIGMYLTWIIMNHLEGEKLQEIADRGELEAVRNRQMTGLEFLIKVCDGEFIGSDLSDEGLAFTLYYYLPPEFIFFRDYDDVLEGDFPSMYHVENTWENYDRIAPVISKAYKNWKSQNIKK